MKKYFLLPFFLLPYFFGFAQNEENHASKWGIGIRINTVEKLPPLEQVFINYSFLSATAGNKKDNSYSIGTQLSYSLGSDIFLRFKYGITNRSFLNTTSVSFPYQNTINRTLLKEYENHFSFGAHLNHSLSQKLDIYFGFDALYINYGQYKIHTELKGIENSINNGNPFTAEGNGLIPGGYSLGLGPYVGFKIKLCSKFQIGAEYSFAFAYSKIGMGKYSDEGSITDDATGTTTYYNNNALLPADNIKGCGIPNFEGSIIITYDLN